MRTAEMLQAHKHNRASADLVKCIDACFECAQCCTTCADACLAEEMADMLARCIRTDLDCADICNVTGRILSRLTQPSSDILHAQLETCAAACRVCAEECDKHASKHDHCRICAECCRMCAESCKRVMAAG